MLTELKPFSEAVSYHSGKSLFPTDLNSAEYRRLESGFLRQSVFSANAENIEVLQGIKDLTDAILNPVTATRPDGSKFTKGMDEATALLKLKELVAKSGYQPAPDERGTIKDLSSYPRRKLIIQTLTQMAQGLGQHLQGNTPGALLAFPCWEFRRFEDRREKRDWKMRWMLAAQVVGDVDSARVLDEHDRMIARKDSGLWQALGDGAGGYTDTFGNPYDPIAFNTGMGRIAKSRSESIKLGLVKAETIIQPTTIEFSPYSEIPDSITDETLQDILKMVDADEGDDDAPLVINRLLGLFAKMETTV